MIQCGYIMQCIDAYHAISAIKYKQVLYDINKVNEWIGKKMM